MHSSLNNTANLWINCLIIMYIKLAWVASSPWSPADNVPSVQDVLPCSFHSFPSYKYIDKKVVYYISNIKHNTSRSNQGNRFLVFQSVLFLKVFTLSVVLNAGSILCVHLLRGQKTSAWKRKQDEAEGGRNILKWWKKKRKQYLSAWTLTIDWIVNYNYSLGKGQR